MRTPPNTVPQDLYTIPQVCHALQIGRSKAYILITAGELEAVKIGRSRRVVAESLQNYRERLRTPAN